MNPRVQVQVQNDLLKYQAELMARTKRLEERFEEYIGAYEKDSTTVRALNMKLERKVTGLERDVRQLQERVKRLEPTVAHIHRRIVLNDAHFLPKVTEKDSALLTAGSLAILFDTSDGSIYAKGNRAAHEATLESKLFAVSCGDDLPSELRDNLIKLFKFAYDK
ncbi:hypothetical protein F5887DRAFT_1073715 [Amanita rubescens]|nr:hypothetical protein F5887DRAFT_1073715 [Amanita rubescens]